jgi:hypothetical protein
VVQWLLCPGLLCVALLFCFPGCTWLNCNWNKLNRRKVCTLSVYAYLCSLLFTDHFYCSC